MGSFVGAHGERVEREPITGVWGQSPWSGDQGALPPWSWQLFSSRTCNGQSKFVPFAVFSAIHYKVYDKGEHPIITGNVLFRIIQGTAKMNCTQVCFFACKLFLLCFVTFDNIRTGYVQSTRLDAPPYHWWLTVRLVLSTPARGTVEELTGQRQVHHHHCHRLNAS